MFRPLALGQSSGIQRECGVSGGQLHQLRTLRGSVHALLERLFGAEEDQRRAVPDHIGMVGGPLEEVIEEEHLEPSQVPDFGGVMH